MKIELKKFQFFERMSEETNAFVADVYVNGVKAGYAKNDGIGGETYIHCYEGKGELIKKAEAFCKSLPKHYSEEFDFSYDMNLESFIDNLVGEEIKKKDQKKMEKKMEKTIMWGVPNGHSYKQVPFKVPLDKIPLLQLQGYVDKYKKDFKKGEQFLNTNLEKLGVKI